MTLTAVINYNAIILALFGQLISVVEHSASKTTSVTAICVPLPQEDWRIISTYPLSLMSFPLPFVSGYPQESMPGFIFIYF